MTFAEEKPSKKRQNERNHKTSKKKVKAQSSKTKFDSLVLNHVK